jgi:alkylation response protein AidB-like acyl-CoA dehydrogenase
MMPEPAAPADSADEFVFSPEQEELRATLRRYLGRHFDRDELRRAIDAPEGFNRASWQAVTRDLGLPAIAVAERLGGAGGTAIELAVIGEELGRVLYCSPWFASCVLAVTALGASLDASAGGLIAPLIAGEATGTVAADQLLSPRAASQVVATAGAGTAGTVSGVAEFVLDGASADCLLVLADDEHGGSLYLLEDRTGVSVDPLATLDLTRRLSALRFSGAPVRRLGPPGNAAAVRDQLAATAGLAAAAESLGGMQACLDQASEYVKTRFQFGRPIGSFQAIKHKVANMLVDVEISRTAVLHAAWAYAGGAAEAPLAVHLAQAQVGDSYLAVAGENIQAHGGIGFTFDHDAHLYFRRAKAAQLMFGDPDYHRDRVAELVGI